MLTNNDLICRDNTCWNNANKNEAKNTGLWVWSLLKKKERMHPYTVKWVSHQWALKAIKTQITHFLFQLRSFIFFWTQLPLFSRVNGNTFFWARPLNVAQGFFHLFYYFLDAFLKKRMAPSFWKSGKSKRTKRMADTLLLG